MFPIAMGKGKVDCGVSFGDESSRLVCGSSGAIVCKRTVLGFHYGQESWFVSQVGPLFHSSDAISASVRTPQVKRSTGLSELGQ